MQLFLKTNSRKNREIY